MEFKKEKEREEKEEEKEKEKEKEKEEEKEEEEYQEKEEEEKEEEEEEEEKEKGNNHNLFAIFHHCFSIILFVLCVFIPLKYYKYIAWILLALSIHWIIFNGCIFDMFHHKDCNNSNIPTNNVTPFFELFNKEFANYIDNNYLKNTMRPTYIIFFIVTLLLTIIIYRLIYNIEFF